MKKPENMMSGLTVIVETDYTDGEVETEWYTPEEWDEAVKDYESSLEAVGDCVTRVALLYMDEVLAEYTEEEAWAEEEED